MKDRVKKNRFYGWTEYSFSLLTLYIMYKLYFKTFDYFLIILLVECVLQSIIWIKGVQKNILCDNYKPNKVFPGYNFYTTITLIISIISLIVFNVYYVVQEYYYVYIIIGDTLYLLHCVTLVGLTFIYQNHLIKKHNLYHLLKNK